jgi:DNA polymerase
MSQLSREDMLRELELLPVWQLRQPLPTQLATQNSIDAVIEPPVLEQATPVQVPPVAEEAVPVSAQPVIELIATEPSIPELKAAPEIVPVENLQAAAILETSRQMPLRLLLSDDGTYAFLIEPYPAEGDYQAVETLLKNMIRAMKVSYRADLTVMPDKLLTEGAPKLIISMGAAAANSLLQKTYALEEWRSQQLQHQMLYETIPVLVTYHPLHLLEHAADKAHAWHDLCLAMKLMQSL